MNAAPRAAPAGRMAAVRAPAARASAGRAGPAPAQDAGRSRFYAAQHLLQSLFDRAALAPTITLAGSTVTLPVERHFGDIDAVQCYVEQVLALNWVHRDWPRALTPVTVRPRRGAQAAHYEHGGAVIAIPPAAGGTGWALRELVVLHELAHHLTGTVQPAHGAVFRRSYLALLDGVIGPEAAFVLTVLLADQQLHPG